MMRDFGLERKHEFEALHTFGQSASSSWSRDESVKWAREGETRALVLIVRSCHRRERSGSSVVVMAGRRQNVEQARGRVGEPYRGKYARYDPEMEYVAGRGAIPYDEDDRDYGDVTPPRYRHAKRRDRTPTPPPPPPPRQVAPPKPRPPPPPPIQRKEAYFREYLHLGAACKSDCIGQREFDPFCLCNLYARQRSVAHVVQRRAGIPAGLRNLGQTCYMNSYLQTLFHTVPVRRVLYSWKNPAPETRDANKQYDLVFAVRNLFAHMQTTSDRSVSPRMLVTAMQLNPGRQQDAQEFQVLFLNWIDQVLAERRGEEKLQSLFKGKLRSTIRCQICNGDSVNETDFYNFTLQAKNVTSIEGSLGFFFADEQIDGYTCQNCGPGVVGVKSLKPVVLPRFLNLHLLRYSFDMRTFVQQKLTHSVTFPHLLDLKPFMDVKLGEGETRYELMAILIHVGVVAGGHYYARIRAAVDGHKWHTFNDEYVSPYFHNEVDQDSRDAYLLVYEKQRDVEHQVDIPPIPIHMDIPAYGLGGSWQVPDLRQHYGKSLRSVTDFLKDLRARDASSIIWVPSEWLTDVARVILGDEDCPATIPAPNMAKFLCDHGRVPNFRGLKAVNSAKVEQLFDVLGVVPIPFFVDGSMFCDDCASGVGAIPKGDDDSFYG